MSRFRWLPTGSPFEERPFRRVFERVRRPLPPDPEIVTAYTDGQVTLRSNRSKEGYHEATDLSGFQGVKVGDFVVHGLDILRGSVGVSDSVGALSSVCIVCVPRVESDPRFFAYAMRAQAWAGVPRALAKGVREGGADFRRWETLAELPLPAPSLHEQRALADHLDAETLHIDALISKKRRLIEVLQERWRAEVTDTVFGNVPLPWVAIRRIVSLLPGFAFPSSDYVDDGIRLLRGVNIAPGRLRWDSDVVYLAAENRPYPSEYELAEGDVVLGMDRPVVGSGLRIALVSASDLPCQLVQRVARIRGTKYADTRYIRFVIDSDAFIAYFSPIVTGVSVPHISADQILSFRVPLPSYDVQLTLAAQMTQRLTSLTSICDRLSAQIDLLTERRQALITAAVAGEISVPGLAA